MSDYAYQVVRWPFAIAGADLNWTVRNTTGGGADSVQAISAGTYICDGDAGAVAPIDIIKRLQTTIAAGITALTVSGTITVNLRTDGRVDFVYSGLDKNIALKNLTANQIAYLGVGASQITGGIFPIGVAAASGTITTSYQAGSQWLPGIDADYDSSDLQRQIVSEGRNLKGRVRRVVRSYATWVERRLDWSRIAGARMSDARAASSLFAGVAGVTTSEDNTWEALWLYLTGAVGPYGDNRVYIYSTNDPSTAVQTGPYDVILSDSEPGLAGLPSGGYVQGMASEYYAARLALVEGGS